MLIVHPILHPHSLCCTITAFCHLLVRHILSCFLPPAYHTDKLPAHGFFLLSSVLYTTNCSKGQSIWSSSTSAEETKGSCGTSCFSVAGTGHCIVYTDDGVRFEVPIAFFGTTVFGKLFRMPQEEFGFAGVDSGRITLPCDASVMEYALCLLRRSASAEMEAAFLYSMAMPCHYHAAAHLGVSQHFGVCSS